MNYLYLNPKTERLSNLKVIQLGWSQDLDLDCLALETALLTITFCLNDVIIWCCNHELLEPIHLVFITCVVPLVPFFFPVFPSAWNLMHISKVLRVTQACLIVEYPCSPNPWVKNTYFLKLRAHDSKGQPSHRVVCVVPLLKSLPIFLLIIDWMYVLCNFFSETTEKSNEKFIIPPPRDNY